MFYLDSFKELEAFGQGIPSLDCFPKGLLEPERTESIASSSWSSRIFQGNGPSTSPEPEALVSKVLEEDRPGGSGGERLEHEGAQDFLASRLFLALPSEPASALAFSPLSSEVCSALRSLGEKGVSEEGIVRSLVLFEVALEPLKLGLAESPASGAFKIVRGDDQMDVRALRIEVRLAIGERIGSAQREIVAREILQDRGGDHASIQVRKTQDLMVENIAVLAGRQEAGVFQELPMERSESIPIRPKVLEDRLPSFCGLIEVFEELTETDRLSRHGLHDHPAGRKDVSNASSSRSRSSSPEMIFRALCSSPQVVR